MRGSFINIRNISSSTLRADFRLTYQHIRSPPGSRAMVTTHNGYARGTADYPFWVMALPTVPSRVIFAIR
jgi:hypothetical protein